MGCQKMITPTQAFLTSSNHTYLLAALHRVLGCIPCLYLEEGEEVVSLALPAFC